jgi:DNA polymerase I-like protein with 3'-5' exonuclease and polymerase domains
MTEPDERPPEDSNQAPPITFEMTMPRRRNADVVATIRAVRDGVAVFQDGVNLSLARGRQQFFNGLAESLDGTCPTRREVEAALLRLLIEAEEQIADAVGGDDVDGEAGEYTETPNGIVRMKPSMFGTVPTPLTNFTARIVDDVLEDDGSGESRRVFELEARLAGRIHRFSLPADTFTAMNWPAEQLGAQAIIYPTPSARDHTRVAIQLFSAAVHERRIYTHTGWRKVDGRWLFLHAGGAIGPNGPVSDIEVSLAPPLDLYELPDPPTGGALRRAVRASLGFLETCADPISVPLYGSIWRAILGDVDYAVHASGDTGAGKSEEAALAQQHFGPGMDRLHLPGSWSSTGNSLEGAAFAAKDVLFVVDDFAPTGTSSDIARLHRDADRVLRAQGNRSGRMRMRADGTLRPTKPPRGLILSTGEDIPRGASLRARMGVVEIEKQGPRSVRWEAVTRAQQDAADGLFAEVVAGFVQWLALHYEAVRQTLRSRISTLRERAIGAGSHRRTPELVANIALGWAIFLEFALATEVLAGQEVDELNRRVWAALGEFAAEQGHYQRASDPVARFLELLSGAIASKTAYLATPDGNSPPDAAAWGWERMKTEDGVVSWKPGRTLVGWLEGDNAYLEPEQSFALVQRLAGDQGDSIAIGAKTLHKRMREQHVLVVQEPSQDRTTVRKSINGKRQRVLAIPHRVLSAPEPVQSGQSGQSGQEPLGGSPSDSDPDPGGGSGQDSGGPDFWTDSVTGLVHAESDNRPTPRESGPPADSASGYAEGCGPPGPIGPEMEPPRVTVMAIEAIVTSDQHVDLERPNLREPVTPVIVDVLTEAQVDRMLQDLSSQSLVGVDIETSGLDPLTDSIGLVQIAAEDHVYLVDISKVAVSTLTSLFAADTGPTLVFHNAEFDLSFLVHANVPMPPACRLFDTMIAEAVLRAGVAPKGAYESLKTVVGRRLAVDLSKGEQTSNWLTRPLTDEQRRYAALDPFVLLPIVQQQLAELTQAKLNRVFEIEMGALPPTVSMELNGMPFDIEMRAVAYVDALKRRVDVEEALDAEARANPVTRTRLDADTGAGSKKKKAAVQRINWGSPKQVLQVLQERGHSITGTAKEALVPLERVDPIVPLIIEYRERARAAQWLGNDGYSRYVHPSTGRIHAHFHLIGAETGRMSCSRPNLQGVSKAPSYRAIFHPGPGRVFVEGDFSQVQFRIAAHLSQATEMLTAYRDSRDADLHTLTAAMVLGADPRDVSPKMRQRAKAINFGFTFGMGAERFLAYAYDMFQVRMTLREARDFQQKFFRAYPGLRAWLRRMPKGPVDTRTILGRRRLGVTRFTEIVNSPCSGSEADLLKLTLARLWEHLSRVPSAVIVNVVHDSVLIECDEDEADRVRLLLIEQMEAAGAEMIPDVPIVAEAKAMRDWSGTPLGPF